MVGVHQAGILQLEKNLPHPNAFSSTWKLVKKSESESLEQTNVEEEQTFCHAKASWIGDDRKPDHNNTV